MSTVSREGAPEPLALDIDGRTVSALRRRPLAPPPRPIADAPEGGPRLLCLHGWLDNAASFVPLMEHLPHVDVVALDLPGHGASDALETGYSLVEMVYRARRAMQCLGWERCHLAGHSLGGCIAPLLAVADPEAIASLILIEASGPLSERAEALPERLRRSLAERLDGSRFRSRVFPDLEAAVAARLKAARMERASARLIVERQLEPAEGGWRWRFDPRLRAASPQYQTEAQVRAVLGAVVCPTLTVIATEGFLAAREDTEARLAALADRVSLTLPGHHHVHMDTPAPVAAALNRFLDATPAPDTAAD